MFDTYSGRYAYLACARDIYVTQHIDIIHHLSIDRIVKFVNFIPYNLDECDPTHLCDAMILFHYARKDL